MESENQFTPTPEQEDFIRRFNESLESEVGRIPVRFASAVIGGGRQFTNSGIQESAAYDFRKCIQIAIKDGAAPREKVVSYVLELLVGSFLVEQIPEDWGESHLMIDIDSMSEKQQEYFDSLVAINPLSLYPTDMLGAFIGIAHQYGTAETHQNIAAFDYSICKQIMMERDGMEEHEADEFLAFNTIGSYNGPFMPVFIFPVEKCDYDEFS